MTNDLSARLQATLERLQLLRYQIHLRINGAPPDCRSAWRLMEERMVRLAGVAREFAATAALLDGLTDEMRAYRDRVRSLTPDLPEDEVRTAPRGVSTSIGREHLAVY